MSKEAGNKVKLLVGAIGASMISSKANAAS